MAKITLREYNREIEQLIEKGLTEEAIAHCKHIFKSYPKHIDTYRLLGKTYLESQRYTEATDILKRVLSVVPDDFISQIGMSIIREDEGDLDGAIWHMERAFEVQPSNPAVQDELRRLYGRRDGVQPPKIRLTRGALVRMYARGELYPQAIAEIRAALAENPNRPDLECILARMVFLSGRKAECIDLCSRLISQLPYCYEANHILSEVLPGTPQAAAAETYRARVIALDPYAAHTGPTALTPADVPDSAVVLEHFVYQASQESEQLPAWTNAVGIAWEADDKPEVPDWLAAVQQRTAQELPDTSPDEVGTPFIVESGAPEHPADSTIPDWMSSAGWAPAIGPETPPEPIVFGEELGDSDITPAEVPDWLRNMAPPVAETESESSPEDLQKLEALLPTPDTSEPAPKSSETLPDWLTAIQAREAQEGVDVPYEEHVSSNTEAEIPDWLQGLGETPAEPLAEASAELPESAAAAEIPDWLHGLGETPAESPAEPIATQPEPAAEAEIPEWLQGLGETPAESMAEPLGEQPVPAAEAEIPDWLQGMGEAPAESPAEPIATQPEPAAEAEIPDWLQGLGETPAESMAEPLGEQPVPAAVAEIPDWLQDLGEAPALTSDVTPAELPEAAATADIPDFLQGLGGTAEESALVPEIPELESQPEEVRGWQADFESRLAALPSRDEDLLSDDEITKPTVIQSTMNIEAPLSDASWLDSSTQIADIESQEPVSAEIPDWLQGIGEEAPAVDEDRLPTVETPSEAPTPAEFPDWLQGISQAATVSSGELLTPVEATSEELVPAQIPDPLQGFFDETLATGEESVLPSMGETVSEPSALSGITQDVSDSGAPVAADDMDAALAWLESLAAKQGADEETLLVPPDQRIEMPPEWVTRPEIEPTPDQPHMDSTETGESIIEDLEVPEPSVSEKVEIEPIAFLPGDQLASTIPSEDATDMDAALAWLESLAAKQGADEETLLVPPGQRMDAPPDWVFEESLHAPDMEDSVIEGPIPTAEAEPLPTDLPEWLQEHTGSVETAPASEDELQAWLQGVDESASALDTKTVSDVEQIPMPSVDQAPQETQPESKELEFVEEISSPESKESGISETVESVVQSAPVDQAGPEPADEFVETADATTLPELTIMDPLERGQESLRKGQMDEAVASYAELIDCGDRLEEVVHDLREALYRFPVDIALWQTLGDAYARNNQLQEALDAYTKAEELLR